MAGRVGTTWCQLILTFTNPKIKNISQKSAMMAMFLRFKRVKGREYLFLVENYRLAGRVRQRIIHSFGRRERIQMNTVRQVLARMPGFAYFTIDAPEPRVGTTWCQPTLRDARFGRRRPGPIRPTDVERPTGSIDAGHAAPTDDNSR